MTKLIIVCGLPGSGKTTLASELSKRLGIVCIHKDVIKESLYDSLGCSTLEDSKRIGLPSIKAMLDLVECQLANGIDVIMEAPFNFVEDYPLLEAWENKYSLFLYSIICSINKEERKKRFLKRERANAHHDWQRSFDQLVDGEVEYDYRDMPGKQIRVSTYFPAEELVKKIILEIK